MKKLFYLCSFLFALSFPAVSQDNPNGVIITTDDESSITVGDSSYIMTDEYDPSVLDSIYSRMSTTGANKNAVYTIDQVPNPKTINNTNVSDPDHYLQTSTVEKINTLLRALEEKNTDQVAVVVLNSIGQEIPKTFATALFNKWGIGIRGKDNGLLILMIMDQRRVEFETGYGMESMLPDAICYRIQQTYMVPKFKEENYDQGILEGVQATVDILSNPENSKIAAELKAAIARETQEERLALMATIGSFYVLFILIFYINKRKNKSFKENFKNEVREQLAAISHLRWLLLYVLIPVLFCSYLYFFYSGDSFAITFFAGCYFLGLLFLLEKRIRLNRSLSKTQTEGDHYGNYVALKKSHKYWWTAALAFPFFFVFYLLYLQVKKRALRNHPRNCKSCQNPLLKLSETEDDQHLKKTELLEEGLRSIDYDVWICKSCAGKEVYGFANSFSKYSACKSCRVTASYLFSDRTVVSASYSSSGTGCKTYKCKNCSYEREETYTIPMKTSSSSSGSGGGGGSFGGGSSGGGGSGSSW